MKKAFNLFAVLALCIGLGSVVARAQGVGGGTGDGPCNTSPENPTLILAAIGAGGASLAALRVKLAARGTKKK